MDNLMIEIPIKTTCDPSVLLDLAIEASEQFVEEIRMHDGEATVDEEEILVRPAGLTSLERELLEALKFMTAYSALNDDGCIREESELVDVMLNPDDPGNVGRTIDMARAAIAKAGGAK
tara:strand:+ start:151 stop:507 length:357 start_codon:yes stop_codon:yes gene_type:complete